MMIKAHFDGKVLVPDEPVNLQKDQRVELTIQPLPVEPRTYMTAGELLEGVCNAPELTAAFEELAAGRDSVDVARELRRRAERREPNDPHRFRRND